MDKAITVLVTAAGAMPAVAIINALKRQQEIPIRVVAVDIYALCAGRYLSDHFSTVPPAADETYVERVLDLCRREKVHVVFPVLDEEQLVFADQRERFEREGICVIANDPTLVRLARDKYRTHEFCRAHGISTPLTLLPDEVARSETLGFPLIVKPRVGQGSNGVFKATNVRELEFFLSYVRDPIVQQFLDGQEYTIDILTDFQGRVISVVPKARLAVKAGVQVKGCTVRHNRLLQYGQMLAGTLGLAPRANIQCIEMEDHLHLIEVNPKFPASLPLTVAAGVNAPLLLVMMWLGRRVDPMIGQFREGLVMLRYWQEIFVERERLTRDDAKDGVFAHLLGDERLWCGTR